MHALQSPQACPYRKLDSHVAVMEATDHGLSNDPARPLDSTPHRRVLAERQVRSALVVVCGVAGYDPAEVTLAEHDDVVDALASIRSTARHRRFAKGCRAKIQNPEVMQPADRRDAGLQ